jgi:hypothetical protein
VYVSGVTGIHEHEIAGRWQSLPSRITGLLRAVPLACCLALSAVATGCGSSPASHGAVAPSAPTSVHSTQSPRDPHAQILAAYTGMWHAFADSAHTADYQPGPLQPYTAGDALSALTHGLYENHRHGVVIRGALVLDPRVTSMTPARNPSRARVTDCADDAHWLEYSTSGRRVSGSPAGKHRIYAWLRLFGTAWKVTEVVVEKAGTCQ